MSHPDVWEAHWPPFCDSFYKNILKSNREKNTFREQKDSDLGHVS